MVHVMYCEMYIGQHAQERPSFVLSKKFNLTIRSKLSGNLFTPAIAVEPSMETTPVGLVPAELEVLEEDVTGRTVSA